MPLPSLPSSEEILAALVGGGLAGWLGRAWIARERRLGADHDVDAKAGRERERLLAEERAARIAQAGEVQRALVALAESIASGMTKNHDTYEAIIRRFETLFESGEGFAPKHFDERLARIERRLEALGGKMRGTCSECGREHEERESE